MGAVMDIGRVCVKIAGREAGRICVIVDIIDDNFVLIDGYVRRKRCNIKHLEPLPYTIDIQKGAPTEEVLKKLEQITKGAKTIRELKKKLG